MQVSYRLIYSRLSALELELNVARLGKKPRAGPADGVDEGVVGPTHCWPRQDGMRRHLLMDLVHSLSRADVVDVMRESGQSSRRVLGCAAGLRVMPPSRS